MMTTMFNKLSQALSRTESSRNASVRNSRTNRRYSFNMGIEILEGRLAPSGGIAPVGVTVTNQTSPVVSSTTTTNK